MSNNNLKDIIIFQEDEVALGYHYDSRLPKDFPTYDVLIKSAEYDRNFFVDNRLEIIGDKPKSPNDVFFKHPYLDNTYINSNFSELQSYFLKQKIDFYKKVAKDLGATNIKATVNSIDKEEDKISVGIDGKHVKGVNIKVDYDSDEKSKLTNKYSFESTFERQENFNLSNNIDNLKKFINDHNLNHEIDLISLITSRDSRISGNLLKSEKIHSEISAEFNKLKKVSGRLRVPIFSLSSDFQREVSTYTKIELSIEYIF
ncbi:hypothetical protein ACTS91_12635 [Empedobacter falsenii]